MSAMKRCWSIHKRSTTSNQQNTSSAHLRRHRRFLEQARCRQDQTEFHAVHVFRSPLFEHVVELECEEKQLSVTFAESTYNIEKTCAIVWECLKRQQRAVVSTWKRKWHASNAPDFEFSSLDFAKESFKNKLETTVVTSTACAMSWPSFKCELRATSCPLVQCHGRWHSFTVDAENVLASQRLSTLRHHKHIRSILKA